MALPLYRLADDPPAALWAWACADGPPGVMNCRRGTTCGAPWGGIRCGWEGGGLLVLLLLVLEGGPASAAAVPLPL